MPGFLVHQGANVVCTHMGQATPVTPFPRVKVSGQPIVVQTSLYSVAGCTMPPPPNGNGPCVSAQWMSVATRVRANNVPVVLQDSQALCSPTGTPLTIITTQTRVRGM